MNLMKYGIWLPIFLLINTGIVVPEVTMVRRLPYTGENRTEAHWKKPEATPDVAQRTGRTELSGRVTTGTSMGRLDGDPMTFDFSTDSLITVIHPFSQSGSASLTAEALRKRLHTGTQQHYRGSAGVLFEKFSIEVSGGYEDEDAFVTDTAEYTRTARFGSALELMFIPTLPMSVAFDADWIHREEDEVLSQQSSNQHVQFVSRGRIGNTGVELSSDYVSRYDSVTEVDISAISGKGSVTVPILSFLSLTGSAAPNWNTTLYQATGNTLYSRSLNSVLGILLGHEETFEARVLGKRNDEWKYGTTPEGDMDEHAVTWGGETGIDFRAPGGFFTGGEYLVSKMVGGNLFQSLNGSVGWAGTEENILQETSAEGGFTQSISETRSVLANQVLWGSRIGVLPFSRLLINLAYHGGVNSGTEQPEWNHKLGSSLQNGLNPSSGYRVGYDLTLSESESGNTTRQDYSGNVFLRPEWKLRVFSFEVSERFSMVRSSTGDDLFSNAAFTTALPVFSFTQLRYGFQWEWLNNDLSKEEPDNAFRHLAGLTLSGEPLPFLFSAEYAVGHGFRGIRHDLTSLLEIPFRNGFSLNSDLKFGYYTEEEEVKAPFLMNIFLSYQF